MQVGAMKGTHFNFGGALMHGAWLVKQVSLPMVVFEQIKRAFCVFLTAPNWTFSSSTPGFNEHSSMTQAASIPKAPSEG
jgi:hypothetical protein